MACLEDLSKALASAPLAQPCTAAAVRALHIHVHAAAQQLFPELCPGFRLLSGVVGFGSLREACTEQHLPAACMPVLAWLGDGLSSGLGPAVSQQALEVACMLLGVVALAAGALNERRSQGRLPPHVAQEAARLLRQLGAFEDVCKQLAQVASAVLAVFMPVLSTDSGTASTSSSSKAATAPTKSTKTTTSSGTSSSSRRTRHTAPPLQQVLAVMFAWKRTTQLASEAVCVLDEAAVLDALTSSGLYQVLAEGTLLLLSLDPQAYSQAAEGVRLQLAAGLLDAWLAVDILACQLGSRLTTVLCTAHTTDTAPGSHTTPSTLPGSSGSSSCEPWMPPMFKLQVLLLAKMQWDVVQRPDQAVRPQNGAVPWPAAALTKALRMLRSPYVAGDLLQQRAPGLLAHTFKGSGPLGRSPSGVRWMAKEVRFSVIPVSSLAGAIGMTARAMLSSHADVDAIDAQDLALLLEVTELYCLVSPSSGTAGSPEVVTSHAWLALMQAVKVCPYPVLARFAATCGEALLSIAEYLVEDVLLVASGAVAGFSSSSSSSSRKCSPEAGGQNPAVTLEHRVKWAQDAMSMLCFLMSEQHDRDEQSPKSVDFPDNEVYGVGVVHSLFTDSTARGLLRLFEVALRTPELQGEEGLQNLLASMPWRLPLLHMVASSTGGSRALLSAVTSAAKQQQVGQAVLSALIQSRGKLAPAAAAVVAAVPGRMGRAVALQVLKQPEAAVLQAVNQQVGLTCLAMRFMARAAALLDPVLAPLAAYLAATQLPPGQDSKPWTVEAAVDGRLWQRCQYGSDAQYKAALTSRTAYMAGIMKELTEALSLQQADAARKQATRLAEAAGGGAAQEESLRQQLQGMWLGRDGDLPAGPDDMQRELLLAMSQTLHPSTSAPMSGGASSSSSGCETASVAPGLPHVLHQLCECGALKQQEVLAAGDPSRWSSALGPTTEEDLRVASTALLAACKAAGAVAQLPGLLEQLQPILQEQPWGQGLLPTAQPRCDPAFVSDYCSQLADWALLLVPLLAVLLPAQLAAELQEVAAGVPRGSLPDGACAVLPDATTACVLGLLGHVVAPGAPGCSYPGCCNLEGRSELDMLTLACTRCRGARYCCKEHQVAHWKAGHKEVCQAAQAAAQQVQGMADVGG